MKVRMIADWSDRSDHPKKNDELTVVDKFYEDNGDVSFYQCKWKDYSIDVYPEECQEL